MHAYTKIPDSHEESSLQFGSSRQTTLSYCLEMLFPPLSPLHIDAKLLLAAKGVRMFSLGFLTVMLVVYLEEIGFSVESIGILFALTLFGGAIGSLGFTTYADRMGRKNCLAWGAVLSFLGALVFTITNQFWIILIASILGFISPSGWFIIISLFKGQF